jgi:hypothetical protein
MTLLEVLASHNVVMTMLQVIGINTRTIIGPCYAQGRGMCVKVGTINIHDRMQGPVSLDKTKVQHSVVDAGKR